MRYCESKCGLNGWDLKGERQYPEAPGTRFPTFYRIWSQIASHRVTGLSSQRFNSRSICWVWIKCVVRNYFLQLKSISRNQCCRAKLYSRVKFRSVEKSKHFLIHSFLSHKSNKHERGSSLYVFREYSTRNQRRSALHSRNRFYMTSEVKYILNAIEFQTKIWFFIYKSQF